MVGYLSHQEHKHSSNCINAGSEIRKRTDRHKFTCKIMLWVNAWQGGNYCRNSTLMLSNFPSVSDVQLELQGGNFCRNITKRVFQTSQVYLMFIQNCRVKETFRNLSERFFQTSQVFLMFVQKYHMIPSTMQLMKYSKLSIP